jgi:hypothetical protein
LPLGSGVLAGYPFRGYAVPLMTFGIMLLLFSYVTGEKAKEEKTNLQRKKDQ